MTKAQATAQARAINLTKADLPSFRAEPNPTTAADRAANAQMAKCAGGVPPGKAVVDSGSPSFTQGSGLQQIEADSSVTVMPSAALVQQDLAAFRSKKARQCVSTLIGGELERSSNGQVQITGLRMTPLSPPAHGTDGAFGYRFTMTAVAGSMRIPFYAELWGFAHGPLEVGLTTFGIGTPFPRDLATKLWGVLVTRAAGTPS